MPRGVHVTRVLPILTKQKGRLPKPQPHGPKLFNAHRRVPRALGVKSMKPIQELKQDHLSQSWRADVSKDVAEFIDDMEAQGTKLLPEEQETLLRSPAHYFSRPQNVPVNLREQVYFPKFSVTMRRQVLYGPYYAQFHVPLWFSKLDLKGYLKQVYNVDVVHIRSYTAPTYVMRKSPSNPYTRGPLHRQKARKRMTVQLVEPFEWPVKPEDIDKSAFETHNYWDQTSKQTEESKRLNPYISQREIDRQHRKTIAEQAQEILEGKAKWGPTWQSIPSKAMSMKGVAEPKKTEMVLPNIKKADAMKGRTIRVF